MLSTRQAVTALIPIKDGARHVANLQFQLNKTLQSQDEIILVNDCSTDNTLALLREWSKRDSRVNLIDNKKLGIANALNLGLTHASHNWVARFDVDDMYRADRIEKQFLAISPEVVVVFSDYSFRSISGKPLGSIPSAVYPEATSVSLFSSQRTPHPVALLNRDAVNAVGGYMQDDFPAEDLSLWLRLSRVGKLVSAPHNLLSYTINPSGVSSTKREVQLSKKVELLTSIGINSRDYEYVLENLIQIYSNYELLDQSFLRKIFLQRELFQIAELQKRKITKSKWQVIQGIRTADFLEISKFGFSTLRRRTLRYFH